MDKLQIVAEPRRRQILRLVWDRELPAGEIASHFDVGFGAVSQHLGVLRQAGFVRMRREGKQHLYRADFDGLGQLKQTLEQMWSEQLDRLAQLAEAAEKSQNQKSEDQR